MATGQLHRNHDKRRVLQIAHHVSATIGNDFFHAMAKHLAEALEADCVFVGEFISGHLERVRMLASFPDGLSEAFEYPLSGSAASKVALGKAVLCRSVAQYRFPDDRALASLRAQAFIGVPLATPAGAACGVLMAVYRKPVASLSVAKSILEIFAPRAAAEVERTREAERLRESEQRYQAFVLLNGDAMWRVEFEQPISTSLTDQQQFDQIYQTGYVAECNDALARLLGFERASQAIGSRLADLVPVTDPSMREATMLAIRAGYRCGTVETTPLDGRGNRRHMLRCQWGIVEDGMLQRIWGTTRDITDLKTIERELDASEQQISDLLEALHLLVVMLHEDGTVAFCNKHLFQLTGWTAADVTGNDWFELMLPAVDRDKAQQAFTAAKLQSCAPTHYESTLLGPKGRSWCVAWDSTCVRDPQGNIVMSANVGRDISEYKMLETRFRQAQEFESLGRLAGGIAHDFNNLLTVITGYSSVLLEEMDPSDPAYAALVEIRKSAEKGADLTQSLLTFSRRQTPHPEPLDLTALIAHDEPLVLRLIGEDVLLTTDLEPSLPLVQADAGQVRQVLFNLVVNARDAMPHGGRLILSTSNQNLNDGQYVQLIVTDTGNGMKEQVRAHLFDTSCPPAEPDNGSALGLATVSGIIRQSGGRIEVVSAPGEGTTFRILFPTLPRGTQSEPSPNRER